MMNIEKQVLPYTLKIDIKHSTQPLNYLFIRNYSQITDPHSSK
jgi:hypothetical protein